MIERDLLEILCCPETHQPLAPAPARVLAGLNVRVAEGSLRNAGGETVAEALAEGLLRQDGAVIYPIREGVPILMGEEGIRLTRINLQLRRETPRETG